MFPVQKYRGEEMFLMRKYYLIPPPTPLTKTEAFLTCSQMACAKGSWIQNGVQAEPQISL